MVSKLSSGLIIKIKNLILSYAASKPKDLLEYLYLKFLGFIKVLKKAVPVPVHLKKVLKFKYQNRYISDI